MFTGRLPSTLDEVRSLDHSRLLLAVCLSLLLHLVVFGTYKAGQKLGVWQKLNLSPMKQIVEELKTSQQQLASADNQPPLMFVDVNPNAESVEPTKDTQYYSDKSSQAANPLTDQESDVPMVNGSQTEIVRTEDVPPPLKAVPLQPSMPEPAPNLNPSEEEEVPETKQEQIEGDLLMAKAEEGKQQKEPTPPEVKPRPRTLKEALAQLPETRADALAGRKMKQDGGVRRLATTSSLDVRASPFGEYDRAIIVAIQNAWYGLLDKGFGVGKSGKVVLDFRLHYDGRITDMTVVESTVDEMHSLLCQRAVMYPAPYARWPSDMRRMIGADYRDVRFTFYYN